MSSAVDAVAAQWEAVQARQDEADLAEAQTQKASEAMLRNRAWLGREFLTWLLYRSESTEPVTSMDGVEVSILFVGPVVFQGVSGEATELRAKGVQAAYSQLGKEAMGRGLLLHQGRVRILYEDQVFEVTLDAEHLAHRGARIPALMTEEEDDKLSERLYLVDRLASLVDALWAQFLEVRTTREWSSTEVPALLRWLKSSGQSPNPG